MNITLSVQLNQSTAILIKYSSINLVEQGSVVEKVKVG